MQKLESPSCFIGINNKDFISFGSGQPDLEPPEPVFNIIQQLTKGWKFQYGLVQGQPELREALSRYHQNLKIKPDNFIITNGSSEAIDLALRILINPGDYIVMLKPFYYSYPHYVKINKGRPVYCSTNGSQVDLEEFEFILKSYHPKAFILNSPGNPTGAVFKPSTIKSLIRLCKNYNVYVISDEVYSKLIYEGEHYSPRGDNIIGINSFSKTFSMCGLRVGYAYSTNDELIKKMIEIKTHTSMNTNTLVQEMALQAINTPQNYIRKQFKVWKERRDYIYEKLMDMGLSLGNPQGAFYVLPKIKNPDRAVSKLFFDYKTITYKGEWFGAPGHIRLSYALDLEKIKEGLKRIEAYLKTCNI